MRIPNYLKRIAFVLITFFVFFWFRKYLILIIRSFYENYSIDGLVSEVIGGMTTSIIIFIFYILLTPVIEISPKIVRYEDGRFKLKIYNSSFFSSFEVRAILTKVTPVKAGKGKQNVEVHDIETSLQYIEYLPSMFNMKSRRSGNTFAVVYTVIDTDEDIKSILTDKKDSSFYRLTISCKNGFTGLRKIKTENYTYKSSVIEGEFESGATFKLI